MAQPQDQLYSNDDGNNKPIGIRLTKALDAFKKILNRNPSQHEIDRIKKFIAVPDQSQMTFYDGPNVITEDQISKQGKCEGYSLYFDEKKKGGNLNKAKAWFKKFNGRDPNEQEIIEIQQFLRDK